MEKINVSAEEMFLGLLVAKLMNSDQQKEFMNEIMDSIPASADTNQKLTEFGRNVFRVAEYHANSFKRD